MFKEFFNRPRKNQREVYINGEQFFVRIVEARICDEVVLLAPGRLWPVEIYRSFLPIEKMLFDKTGICSRQSENYLVEFANWYAQNSYNLINGKNQAKILSEKQLQKFNERS